MKKLQILLLTLFSLTSLTGKNLTLEQCFQLAKKNHPLMKQKKPIQQIEKNHLTNINTKWLPTLDMTFSAIYQSDITQLDIKLPATLTAGFKIPQPDKDIYKSEIDIKQLLYDGGLISAEKKLIQQESKLALQNINLGFEKIKSAITQVFYNILLLEKQKKILESWHENLQKNHETMESLIKNGIKEKKDLYEIEIKIKELEQKIEENKIYKKNNFSILEELIGTTINSEIELYNPKLTNLDKKIFNAQTLIFQLQQEKLDITRKISFRKRVPKILGFGKIGYGKPGLNMLANEFDKYYIIGISLQWNIWDWKKSKRDREIIKYNRQIIKYSEEIYNKNLGIELNKKQSIINNLKQKITKDHQIYQLHKKLKNSAEIKFQQGIINTSDYLIYTNNYIRAKLNLEIDKIQLYREETKYLIEKGEL